MRVTRTALDKIGMRSNLMMHGVKREVFICEMAKNTLQFLKGEDTELDVSDLRPVDQVAALACNRWLVPRSIRCPEYQQWTLQDLVKLISKSAGVRVSMSKRKTRKQAKS